MTKPKVNLISLGCSKNLVDSEKILAIVATNGGAICDHPEDAEVVIVNTCGFINSAKEESIDAILQTALLKENANCKKLIVTGCLAQRYKDMLQTEIPEIDYIVGLNSFDKIANNIFATGKGKDKTKTGAKKMLDANCREDLKNLKLARLTPPHYAYLKISDGCDNRCSYCSIPSIRGGYKSRKIEDIVQEAETLVKTGVKELNIIAQDTTLYGRDIYKKQKLGELLNRLSDLSGVKWIRLLYTHPAHFYDELINEIAQNSKICNYIDLPIQHINDEILKRMGRGVTTLEISTLIDKLRDRLPNLVLRTSIITGFPGETSKRFDELVNFVESVRFERLGVFTYSREDDTRAASFKGQISEKAKNERFELLMALQQRIAFENNEKMIGRKLKALVDELAIIEDDSGGDDFSVKKGDDVWMCRSYGDAPEVDGNIVVVTSKKIRQGSFKDVTITGMDGYNLLGDIN